MRSPHATLSLSLLVLTQLCCSPTKGEIPEAGTDTDVTSTSIDPTTGSSSPDVGVQCNAAVPYIECTGDWSTCPVGSICQVSDQGSFICLPLCSVKDGECPTPTNSGFDPECVPYQSSTVVGVCLLPCNEPADSLPTKCPDGTRCRHPSDDPNTWHCSNFET